MSAQEFLATLICKNYTKTGFVETDYRCLPRPFYSFAYVEKGRIECVEGERIVKAEAGDVVFIPYHLRYILRWYGEPEVSVYSCHFMFPPSADLFATKVISLQKLSGKGLREDFLKIHERIADREKMLEVLGLFYGLCHRLYEQMHYRARLPMDKRIRAAADFIERNCCGALSVESMAAVSHMSVSRFYYLFKKETGLSPIEYKNRASIYLAEMLLLNDLRKSIEEISVETGFASTAYFRRVFKAMTGISPREYRQKINT